MMRYWIEAFAIESCSQDGKYWRGGKDSGAKEKYKESQINQNERFTENPWNPNITKEKYGDNWNRNRRTKAKSRWRKETGEIGERKWK